MPSCASVEEKFFKFAEQRFNTLFQDSDCISSEPLQNPAIISLIKNSLNPYCVNDKNNTFDSFKVCILSCYFLNNSYLCQLCFIFHFEPCTLCDNVHYIHKAISLLSKGHEEWYTTVSCSNVSVILENSLYWNSHYKEFISEKSVNFRICFLYSKNNIDLFVFCQIFEEWLQLGQ